MQTLQIIIWTLVGLITLHWQVIGDSPTWVMYWTAYILAMLGIMKD